MLPVGKFLLKEIDHSLSSRIDIRPTTTTESLLQSEMSCHCCSTFLSAKALVQHFQRPQVLAEAHLISSNILRAILLPTIRTLVTRLIASYRSGHTASICVAVPVTLTIGVAIVAWAVSILFSRRPVHERADAWDRAGLSGSTAIVGGGVACAISLLGVRCRVAGLSV